jgi:hypothetical protein
LNDFIAYFNKMTQEYPGRRVAFKSALAEGNHVSLHCHQASPGYNDPDWSSINIFRLDDQGAIVEHGDVLQVAPELRLIATACSEQWGCGTALKGHDAIAAAPITGSAITLDPNDQAPVPIGALPDKTPNMPRVNTRTLEKVFLGGCNWRLMLSSIFWPL